MRSVWRAALVAALVLGLAGPVTPILASTTSDAAHACQGGAYANLHGTDGTTFRNAGDCVSFVARGGTITGVSTGCAFTADVSGCVELDSVVAYVGTTGAVGPDWTSLSGMFSFSPVTSWDTTTTGIVVSGSGTWTTSSGLSGTWSATRRSSIYPTTFFATNPGVFGLCSGADVRYVGVHFDLAGVGVDSGAALEVGIRMASSGTNYLTYQGFGSPSGEPLGIHDGLDVSGVTLRC